MTMRTGLALKEISGKMLELTSGGNVPLSNCSVDPPNATPSASLRIGI